MISLTFCFNVVNWFTSTGVDLVLWRVVRNDVVDTLEVFCNGFANEAETGVDCGCATRFFVCAVVAFDAPTCSKLTESAPCFEVESDCGCATCCENEETDGVDCDCESCCVDEDAT